MSMRIGMPAPDFATDAYVPGEPEPRSVSLSDVRGNWVVLFFYPRDFTFICPTELQALARLQDEFAAAGAVVLAASTDSYHSHKAWFEADLRLAPATYPVLADTSHRLSAAFGVLLADGAALRGTFILDPEGIMRHVQVNDLDVGRNLDETLRTLRALQTGGLCPVAWQPGQPTLDAAVDSGAPAALLVETDERAA